MNKENFTFLDPGRLIDNELELILVKKTPAIPEKGYFPRYEFEMRHSETGEKMGGIHFRVGNNKVMKLYVGHLGYGVDDKFRGKKLASRSLLLLFPLAKKHDINPVWVTCNPENLASKRTCELAGGKFIAIVDLPKHSDQYKRGERKKCRYRFDI